ncbi:MAG: class I SAM-dependent methyltransferase [Chloroflexi bacterium]|nr:class I SAM-dependent methyltransferase [Chloroflexota bacterium]
MRRVSHEANRRSWNAATEAHNSHKLDQAGFLREGGSTLFPEEVELLGDVSGLRLLHLQCNAGQDTLSLARLGVVVTGVDTSDTAIDFARRLAVESGISGTFERADVYDWLATAGTSGRRFDVVFSSYGAIGWLSDLEAWAKGIAAVLEPGGRFVTVEFHPFAMTFDDRLRHAYRYSTAGEPVIWESGVGDYVGLSGAGLAPSGFVEGERELKNPHPAHEFFWGLGEIVSALQDAGLTLTTFREYPYSNGCRLFEDMREEAGRRLYPPERMPSLPLMYAIVARKPVG